MGSGPAGSLWTKTLGEGSQLVLVHGWGFDSAVWADLVAPFAQQFRVTLVDLPGHGGSRGVTMPDDLASLSPMLACAVTGPANWVGWSLGGMAVLQLAADAPDIVRKLVLVDASARFVEAPDWPHGVKHEVLGRFAEELKQDPRGTLLRFVALQTLTSEDAGRVQRRLRAHLLARSGLTNSALSAGLRILASADLRRLLPRVACPTLLVVGERDTLATPQACAATGQGMRHARLQVIRGAGHAPHLSHPEQFVETLVEFLNE
jgi:pimeloyl-[acyl-carrier protein] methyl ester esterase